MTAHTCGAPNLCLNFKSNMFTGAAQATFMYSEMCVQLAEQCVRVRASAIPDATWLNQSQWGFCITLYSDNETAGN